MGSLVPAAPSAAPSSFDRDKIELIKRTVAKGATDDELEIFLHQCQKSGLDPLARQIYFQKRRNAKAGRDDMTIITGIDGYRLTAQRTGQYAGNDDPVFDDEEKPRKATVTVYRIVNGMRCGFSATARWDQYYPGDTMGFMWRKMPHLMLGKCAEALALRKAFPAELSGLYVREEMDQAGAVVTPPMLEAHVVDIPFEGPPAVMGADVATPNYSKDNKHHKARLWEICRGMGIGAEPASGISVRIHETGVAMEHLEPAIKEAWEEMQR